METFLAAVWKDPPVLGRYPVDRHHVGDNLPQLACPSYQTVTGGFRTGAGGLQLEWIAASEAPGFAQLVVATVRRQESSPGGGIELSNKRSRETRTKQH